MIHVFIGTKAQYIKTAPLIRLMKEQGVEYRLIDSGQHAALMSRLRGELGLGEPDYRFGGDKDIVSIPQALRWAFKIGRGLLSRSKLRKIVFDDKDGVCVIHGDTPSTLLAMLMARRAGLRVAHLEAGLRSGHLMNPFPEELIRVLVMRKSDLLFAPDTKAVANLRRMRVRGNVVPLTSNTATEAMRHVLTSVQPDSGPAIATMHRVENLHRRRRVKEFVGILSTVAATTPVRMILHGPTQAVLRNMDLLDVLHRAGVETSELLPHGEFVAALAAAPFVITDGGSIQEECALLGVPTLLWRKRTERSDGLGANVVLSSYEASAVAEFLGSVDSYRRLQREVQTSPSEQILSEIKHHAQ